MQARGHQKGMATVMRNIINSVCRFVTRSFHVSIFFRIKKYAVGMSCHEIKLRSICAALPLRPVMGAQR
jgi:hypothetical protein